MHSIKKDGFIRVEDLAFDNILLDKKSSESISVYDISYKTVIGSKPLPIRPNEVYKVIKRYFKVIIVYFELIKRITRSLKMVVKNWNNQKCKIG